jgi:hypothetical protein
MTECSSMLDTFILAKYLQEITLVVAQFVIY